MWLSPFRTLQGNGTLAAAAAAGGEPNTLWSTGSAKERFEPTSVLDQGWSPSPPTSSSTLSSSLCGGGVGSTDNNGVAAVSDNSQWRPSKDPCSAASAEEGGGPAGGLRKDEWMAELQPIPGSLDFGQLSGEKCGMGLEDWSLSETSAAVAGLPGNEQSLMRWMTEATGGPPSLDPKQQQQLLFSCSGTQFPPDVYSGGGAFGLSDSIFVHGSSGSTAAALAASSGAGGLLVMNSNGGNNQNLSFHSEFLSTEGLATAFPPPQGVPFLGQAEEKPGFLAPPTLLNPDKHLFPQSSPFFLPLTPFPMPNNQTQEHLLPPLPEPYYTTGDATHQISPKHAFPDSNLNTLFRGIKVHQSSRKPALVGDEMAASLNMNSNHLPQQQHLALTDQLLKAAESVEAGNFINARAILARLNQLLSPLGKPPIRSAFYFKEALNSILAYNTNMLNPSQSLFPAWNPSTTVTSPLDVVLKFSAYKAFSEISPLVQFTSFTCLQALLEELNGCDVIHIVDFDIGIGGHWSSFMQELPLKRTVDGSVPSLIITAFVSPSLHHPLELVLIRENLTKFATELNIQFELNFLSSESFDPSLVLNMSKGSGQAIAVNIPVGWYKFSPSLLRMVKQLSPRIVISVAHGHDDSEFQFSQHVLSAMHSLTILLESMDSAGTSSDVVNKIERFLLHPKIESSVFRRYLVGGNKMPHWRTLFTSSGFLPIPFSNFAETQAECLLKRAKIRGFHVEKCQSSLTLFWQHRDLASVSVWRC